MAFTGRRDAFPILPLGRDTDRSSEGAIETWTEPSSKTPRQVFDRPDPGVQFPAVLSRFPVTDWMGLTIPLRAAGLARKAGALPMDRLPASVLGPRQAWPS